jgi:DNA-directed RNA polymerase alpha subunit
MIKVEIIVTKTDGTNRRIVGTADERLINVIEGLILVPTETLKIPISKLNIPSPDGARIANCCRNEGLLIIEDLLYISEEKFLLFRGIGRKSLKVINEALKPQGLHVGFFL